MLSVFVQNIVDIKLNFKFFKKILNVNFNFFKKNFNVNFNVKHRECLRNQQSQRLMTKFLTIIQIELKCLFLFKTSLILN